MKSNNLNNPQQILRLFDKLYNMVKEKKIQKNVFRMQGQLKPFTQKIDKIINVLDEWQQQDVKLNSKLSKFQEATNLLKDKFIQENTVAKAYEQVVLKFINSPQTSQFSINSLILKDKNRQRLVQTNIAKMIEILQSPKPVNFFKQQNQWLFQKKSIHKILNDLSAYRFDKLEQNIQGCDDKIKQHFIKVQKMFQQPLIPIRDICNKMINMITSSNFITENNFIGLQKSVNISVIVKFQEKIVSSIQELFDLYEKLIKQVRQMPFAKNKMKLISKNKKLTLKEEINIYILAIRQLENKDTQVIEEDRYPSEIQMLMRNWIYLCKNIQQSQGNVDKDFMTPSLKQCRFYFDKFDSIIKKIKILHKTKNQQQIKKNKLNQQLSSIKSELINKSTMLEQAKITLKEIQKTSKEHNQKLSSQLKQKIDQLEHQIWIKQQLKNSNDQLRTDMNKKNNKIAQLKSQLDILEQQHNLTWLQISKKQEQNNEFLKKIKSMQQNINDLNNFIINERDKMEKQKQFQKANIKTFYQQQKSKLNNKLQTCEEQLNQRRLNIIYKQSKIQVLQAQIHNLQEYIAKKTSALNQKKVQSDQIDERMCLYQKFLSQLKGQIQASNYQLKCLHGNLSKLLIFCQNYQEENIGNYFEIVSEIDNSILQIKGKVANFQQTDFSSNEFNLIGRLEQFLKKIQKDLTNLYQKCTKIQALNYSSCRNQVIERLRAVCELHFLNLSFIKQNSFSYTSLHKSLFESL